MRTKTLLLFVLLSVSLLDRGYAGFPAVVQASPSEFSRLELSSGVKLIDFDVSRVRPQAVLLTVDAKQEYTLSLWEIGKPSAEMFWAIPKEYQPKNVVFHPEDKNFFLLAKNQTDYVILKVSKDQTVKSQVIFRTKKQLRRLIVGPRPFRYEYKLPPLYRLFFGVKTGDNIYAINSVTEDGTREYQVIGAKSDPAEIKRLSSDLDVIGLKAASALPLSFHPAGHIMLWEDADNCFQKAKYASTSWGDTKPLWRRKACGGTVTVTPNGLGILNWRKGQPGVALYLDNGRDERVLASSYTFNGTPSSTPDGKGIIGEVKNENGTVALVYTPVDVPLADVANAWMFVGNRNETELFNGSGGLLRDLKDDQLYNLYESEFYKCGGYDETLPARPYLVTTDVFWEIYAAAYEGMFVLQERKAAMPEFRKFIEGGSGYFTKSPTRLRRVFLVLLNVLTEDNPQAGSEADKILKAEGQAPSSILGVEQFFYGDLKPRGHYNYSQDTQRYFKAFRYLSMISFTPQEISELQNLPPEIKAHGLAWVSAYKTFIAPSRAPGILHATDFPKYLGRSKQDKPTVFPLAWGMDNEVLNSTVYHELWPEEEQIKGPGGFRMLPSGLDLAAVMGSSLAEALLEDAGEFQKYPPLKAMLVALRAKLTPETAGDNLYDSWINALATQWNDAALVSKDKFAGDTWAAKRLQTGLASWATLRHATVLVNERAVAECGEAGFEDIIMEKPRGYVEPDPATFEAIAGLFAAAAEIAKGLPVGDDSLYDRNDKQNYGLKEGLVKRLSEVREKALMFAAISRKEIAGQQLTEEEYDAIHYLARVAEYNFLVLKSLAKEDLAISTPDPMPKIADVAGGPLTGFLLSAVGRPMEWDAITPYFGRRQITRGAVYSYYESRSSILLNDAEWLKNLPQATHPAWVQKFVSPEQVSCPPVAPF